MGHTAATDLMEHGDAPRLVLTITRACNLRCGFCPLELGQMNMTPDVAARAVAIYKERFPNVPHHVRVFGGEPLLRFDLIKQLVASFPHGGKKGGARFSFPTNGTLMSEDVVSFLRAHPNVEAAVSRVRDAKTLASLPNTLINMCIPPNGASDLAPYVARLLKAGMTRLNFLPAFYVLWRSEQIRALEHSFRLTAELIREWEARGHEVSVRNTTTFNPVPLYNHGMVVDYTGDVFPSNAVLCGDFESLRKRTWMGTVKRPQEIDWERNSDVDWGVVFQEHLNPDVYRSTLAVNTLLTELVHTIHENRRSDAPAAVVA